MADDNKGLMVIGAAAAIAAGLFAWSKAKAEPPEPPPDEEDTTLSIVILDANGNPVPTNSPANLIEGEDYTLRLTVTNTSTKLGTPWEATLWVRAQVATTQVNIFSYSTQEYFLASQTRSFEYPFSVPEGIVGDTGLAIGQVDDPNQNLLANISQEIAILSAAIDYGAIVVIGVPKYEIGELGNVLVESGWIPFEILDIVLINNILYYIYLSFGVQYSQTVALFDSLDYQPWMPI